MRLKCVTAAVEKEPGKLEHYDDAAVACDRLGRHDEAITWMERKKKIMDSMPSAQRGAHPYRYLANLGTFHAHRWVRSQDRGSNLADLDTAIRLVSEAIEVNPAAHFNREPGQLLLLEWLRDGLRGREQPEKNSHSLQPLFVPWDKRFRDRSGFDLTQSLCGIIQRGAAWESIDVYAWLVYSLGSRGGYSDEQNPSLSLLPALRCAELVLSARRSPLHPDPHFRDFCDWSDGRLARVKEPETLPTGYAHAFVVMLCGRSQMSTPQTTSSNSTRRRDVPRRNATRQEQPTHSPNWNAENIQTRIQISGPDGPSVLSLECPPPIWSKVFSDQPLTVGGNQTRRQNRGRLSVSVVLWWRFFSAACVVFAAPTFLHRAERWLHEKFSSPGRAF